MPYKCDTLNANDQNSFEWQLPGEKEAASSEWGC